MRKSKQSKMLLRALREANNKNHTDLAGKYFEARKNYLEYRRKKLSPV